MYKIREIAALIDPKKDQWKIKELGDITIGREDLDEWIDEQEIDECYIQVTIKVIAK